MAVQESINSQQQPMRARRLIAIIAVFVLAVALNFIWILVHTKNQRAASEDLEAAALDLAKAINASRTDWTDDPENTEETPQAPAADQSTEDDEALLAKIRASDPRQLATALRLVKQWVTDDTAQLKRVSDAMPDQITPVSDLIDDPSALIEHADVWKRAHKALAKYVESDLHGRDQRVAELEAALDGSRLSHQQLTEWLSFDPIAAPEREAVLNALNTSVAAVDEVHGLAVEKGDSAIVTNQDLRFLDTQAQRKLTVLLASIEHSSEIAKKGRNNYVRQLLLASTRLEAFAADVERRKW